MDAVTTLDLFRNPRAFYAALRDGPQSLLEPLRLLLSAVLLFNFVPLLLTGRLEFGLFARGVAVGLIYVAFLLALVRLVAWGPPPVRVPEIVGYAFAPLVFGVLISGLLLPFVPVAAQAVVLAAALLAGYYVFVGVDVTMGRAQAVRVAASLPVLAVLALVLAASVLPQAGG